MRFFWLNFHVDYACRHSGACCSSGWPIPVEKNRVTQIHRLSRHADWLVSGAEAPDDVAGALAFGPAGHCVFHGEGGCDVYAVRPSSCSHFPYVCLIDPRGVHVTLSHYCPTAAAMLFEHDAPIAIVEGPAPPTGLDIPEGLDARESLPPLASPDRLMSFGEFSAWEKNIVTTVGAYSAYSAFGANGADRLVAPAWPSFAPVIERYLAARAFASWAAYLEDDGIAAVLRGVETSRAVLQVEATRQCAQADRVLDAALLREAIRQSDLWLVHRADTPVLSSANPL